MSDIKIEIKIKGQWSDATLCAFIRGNKDTLYKIQRAISEVLAKEGV